MAKKMLVYILIAAIVCSFSTIAHAEDVSNPAEDSKLVSDEIVSKIDPTGNGTVFRIYSISLRFGFAYYNNIDEILASSYLLEVLYAKKSNGEYTYWRYKDNECKQTNRTKVNSRVIKMFETNEVIGYIGSDVIVYNTYYLSGETSHRGSAIYYKTNKGDYVYYHHSAEGEKLFPVKAFCAYQKAILNESIQNQSPGLVGGTIGGEVWDLSPYDFRSDTFNLNAPIPGDDDSEQEAVDTPVIPDSPEDNEDDPVIPEPPEDNEDDPVIPDPPEDKEDDPAIPEPPENDEDDPVIPELPEEDVTEPVPSESPEEIVTNPVTPEPSEKAPLTAGEMQSIENNIESNKARNRHNLVRVMIDACLLIVGVVVAIYFWRRRKNA